MIIDNEHFLIKKEQIETEARRVRSCMIGAGEKTQQFLQAHGSQPLKTSATLAELICRPELDYDQLGEIDPDRPELPDAVREQVNIMIKYDGYIRRQQSQVEHFKKMENRRIPEDIDYDDVGSLRLEARQKLARIRPSSIGRASRIAGVSPADISVLMVYIESRYRRSDGNS